MNCVEVHSLVCTKVNNIVYHSKFNSQNTYCFIIDNLCFYGNEKWKICQIFSELSSQQCKAIKKVTAQYKEPLLYLVSKFRVSLSIFVPYLVTFPFQVGIVFYFCGNCMAIFFFNIEWKILNSCWCHIVSPFNQRNS